MQYHTTTAWSNNFIKILLRFVSSKYIDLKAKFKKNKKVRAFNGLLNEILILV